jgi:hypothetical protein
MAEKIQHTQNAASGTAAPPPSPAISLDTWAVIVALALSGAIWIGLIKHIPW